MIPYSGPVVTREEARATGLKRFFTGVMCGRGHLCERHLHSGECVECRKAQRDRYYATNREAELARHRHRYQTHRDKQKQYEVLNRERINANRRKRRLKNKQKINAVKRKWFAKNREQQRAAARRFYLEHRSSVRKAQSEYYRRDPERPRRAKERARTWALAHPQKVSEMRHRRRAFLRQASGFHTGEQIIELYKAQAGKCAICFKKLREAYHIDHIVALARGGSNDIGNIQLTCAGCNTRKGAKDPIDFARELGRLL